MKNIFLLLTLFSFFSCQDNSEKDFPILKDFEENKSRYKIDTIELENISSEGGEVVVYFNKNNGKTVFDFYVYGETGKLNYKYFTIKNLKNQFVIKKDYKYDRPISEKDLKIDSTINYIDFESALKVFDQDGNPVKDEGQISSITSEIDSFFKQTLKNNIVIRK